MASTAADSAATAFTPGQIPRWDDVCARLDARSYGVAIRALTDVASALLSGTDRNELLRLIGQKLCELVGTERCSVYLRDPGTGLYHGQVGYADHDIDAGVRQLTCGVPADGFTEEIVKTRRPVQIQNARTDPRPVRSAMRSWHVHAMLGVPMVLEGEVIGIVFLDSKDQTRCFSALDEALASAFAELGAVAVTQAKLTAELRASLDTVARQNEVLRRAAAVDDRLTSLVLDGGDLDVIVQAVAELTHKPCALYDAEHRRLATASPPGRDGPGPPRLLDPGVCAHPEIADALAALSPKQAAVVGPFMGAGLPHRFLLAPVTVGEQQWATLVLMEHQARLNGFDMLISRRSATVVALALSAERRAADAEFDAPAALAGDLIRGVADSASLTRRGRFLGIDLALPHVVALIRGRDAATVLPAARAVRDALAAAAPGQTAIATGVADGIAVIHASDPAAGASAATDAVKQTLRLALSGVEGADALVTGISTVCRDAGDYPRAYTQADQVVRCLRTFARPGATDILAAADLGAGRILLANADAEETERFVNETLADLLAEPAGDLLLTLCAFFDHGRSIRRAAVQLDVHENTIRYRLARIGELTGLAVATDSDAQLSAQLALLVLRLQGRVPEAALRSAPESA